MPTPVKINNEFVFGHVLNLIATRHTPMVGTGLCNRIRQSIWEAIPQGLWYTIQLDYNWAVANIILKALKEDLNC